MLALSELLDEWDEKFKGESDGPELIQLALNTWDRVGTAILEALDVQDCLMAIQLSRIVAPLLFHSDKACRAIQRSAAWPVFMRYVIDGDGGPAPSADATIAV